MKSRHSTGFFGSRLSYEAVHRIFLTTPGSPPTAPGGSVRFSVSRVLVFGKSAVSGVVFSPHLFVVFPTTINHIASSSLVKSCEIPSFQCEKHHVSMRQIPNPKFPTNPPWPDSHLARHLKNNRSGFWEKLGDRG